MSRERISKWPDDPDDVTQAADTISGILERYCSEDREACQQTPNRWIRAMQELLSGYDVEPRLTRFPATNENMIIKRRIKYYSLCRHHLLPFFGHAHIAYVPREWILGLSKLSRIVDKYSRRLQIQEILTEEIATALKEVLETSDIMVVLTGEHLCEKMRGAENDEPDSTMVTSHVGGVFRDHEVRAEAMALMGLR